MLAFRLRAARSKLRKFGLLDRPAAAQSRLSRRQSNIRASDFRLPPGARLLSSLPLRRSSPVFDQATVAMLNLMQAMMTTDDMLIENGADGADHRCHLAPVDPAALALSPP
jgi:hypothetical protein